MDVSYTASLYVLLCRFQPGKGDTLKALKLEVGGLCKSLKTMLIFGQFRLHLWGSPQKKENTLQSNR